MKLNYFIVGLLGAVAASADPENMPAHYATENGDQLMRLLINKGFAKEKEDNTDHKCGCDCTCCQKRNS